MDRFGYWQAEGHADVTLITPLGQSTQGGSGAFLGLADDSKRYWIKPLNNLQGERVPVTEQIVARAGRLIRAPVCTVKTVRIPDEFSAWPYCYSRALVPGIAHGSQAVLKAAETQTLDFRSDDDNKSRHAYVFALYDWCWGGDDQWLIDLSDDNRYYSHDHGHYFPPDSPNWKRDTLLEKISEPRELHSSTHEVSPIAVGSVASALRKVTREQLINVLIKIPGTWPVTDQELETVGYFLEYRSSQVAERLERRFGLRL